MRVIGRSDVPAHALNYHVVDACRKILPPVDVPLLDMEHILEDVQFLTQNPSFFLTDCNIQAKYPKLSIPIFKLSIPEFTFIKSTAQSILLKEDGKYFI